MLGFTKDWLHMKPDTCRGLGTWSAVSCTRGQILLLFTKLFKDERLLLIFAKLVVIVAVAIEGGGCHWAIEDERATRVPTITPKKYERCH